MAEREGFEPSYRFNPITRFPSVRLQPLGHLSLNKFAYANLDFSCVGENESGSAFANNIFFRGEVCKF